MNDNECMNVNKSFVPTVATVSHNNRDTTNPGLHNQCGLFTDHLSVPVSSKISVSVTTTPSILSFPPSLPIFSQSLISSPQTVSQALPSLVPTIFHASSPPTSQFITAEPQGEATDIISRLSVGPIDRAMGRDVTVAELYLLMSRPKVVTLDYDWVENVPTIDVIELMLNKSLSNRLRRLVDIATTEFVSCRRSASSVSLWYSFRNYVSYLLLHY